VIKIFVKNVFCCLCGVGVVFVRVVLVVKWGWVWWCVLF